MNHSSGLDPVQPRVTADRLSVVEFQNELPICPLTLTLFFQMIFAISWEFCGLPCLTLVFSKVLNDERFQIRDAQHPFPRRVDGKPAQVTRDPTAAQLFRDSNSCSASGEAVEDKVTFI